MNIYWPIYKNLEAGVTKLTYAIHINDSQLHVYSSDISDLILRASAEIESISKELYKGNGGLKTDKIKYDADALEHLNKLWVLDEKVVLISSINCYQSVKELRPFAKDEVSTFHRRYTFSWNNSYQNLKHDRAKSVSFGSVKYLFNIMAALFLLNVYFKNEPYSLGKIHSTVNFPVNMGSELFSIKVSEFKGFDSEINPAKTDDVNECVYLVRHVERFRIRIKQLYQQSQTKLFELVTQHPKFKKYLDEGSLFAEGVKAEYNIYDLIPKIFDNNELAMLYKETQEDYVIAVSQSEYEAVLNKHEIPYIS